MNDVCKQSVDFLGDCDGCSCRLVGELDNANNRADFDEVGREFYWRRGVIEGNSGRKDTLSISVELAFDLLCGDAVRCVGV